MDITLDKKDDQLSAILTVNLTEADYAANVDQKIKDYAKKAQIKGFRPGKVPAGLVRKMYGKGLLADEINERLGKSVDAYIKENNLRILGEPIPVPTDVDFDNQKDFSFQFELGLLPEIELPADQSITVDRNQVSLDEATLTETYDQIGRQFGESTNPEVSEANDYLYGRLKKADAEEEGNVVLLPINKVKNGVERFIGVKPEDSITFDLKDAFDGDVSAVANFSGLSKDEAAEVSGDYTLTVEKINRTDAAEFNQELFDKVFGKDVVTSKEEFDEKVRTTIQENYDRESDNLVNRQIIDKVIDSLQVELPKEFFKKWLVRANQGKLTAEQVEEHYNDYERELKWSMVRNKVVETEGLKVSNDEIVDRTIQKIMGQFNLPEVNEELQASMRSFADNYLRQDNGKNYVDEYEAILAEKVLENLRGKVVVNETPITAEDFRNQNQQAS
ncbi:MULTISPECIES: trigger factor [Hymenobacter]|uniref:Trigger factor n=2 Tax=Hymenobacter TaxID=89966 RepID=A0ABS6X456_9BACT|nr:MULTISPECIES: trigger factor [Hymenobacter]MBO3271826.1 trigger factor [Hymenobacter defluvii]MBW3130489.1 trigger factor [Hymenobacter profundi]QNE40099.1 trigger factor [Hymenobacter sp. NBH84]